MPSLNVDEVIFAIEETFGLAANIIRSKSYLEQTYPELKLPANAIMLRGDAAFSVDLNCNDKQHLEAYSTPFRIPRLDVRINSYKLEGTDTKKVNVVFWYVEERKQKVVK